MFLLGLFKNSHVQFIYTQWKEACALDVCSCATLCSFGWNLVRPLIGGLTLNSGCVEGIIIIFLVKIKLENQKKNFKNTCACVDLASVPTESPVFNSPMLDWPQTDEAAMTLKFQVKTHLLKDVLHTLKKPRGSLVILLPQKH